jgi:hypothetical protein
VVAAQVEQPERAGEALALSLPASQVEQLVDALELANLPAVHDLHELATFPAPDKNLPLAQLLHTDEDFLSVYSVSVYLPLVHLEQESLPSPAEALYRPIGQ